MYLDRPIQEYLNDLAAKKPAPGGGSAAALAGALGASLLEMSANFTIGKEKYRAYERAAMDVASAAAALRTRFSAHLDEDVAAYGRLAYAFKLKKGAGIDDALKEATIVPLAVAEDALEGLKAAVRLADACNPNLISDVGVACEMLEAAYEGAKYNIAINLTDLKDGEFTSATRNRLASMDTKVSELGSAIARKVTSIIGRSA